MRARVLAIITLFQNGKRPSAYNAQSFALYSISKREIFVLYIKQKTLRQRLLAELVHHPLLLLNFFFCLFLLFSNKITSSNRLPSVQKCVHDFSFHRHSFNDRILDLVMYTEVIIIIIVMEKKKLFFVFAPSRVCVPLASHMRKSRRFQTNQNIHFFVVVIIWPFQF